MNYVCLIRQVFWLGIAGHLPVLLLQNSGMKIQQVNGEM
jgi:hypothetical protein